MDKLTFPNRTNRFTVTECLPHPMYDPTISRKRLGMFLPRGYENRIEHGRALTLEMMIRRDAVTESLAGLDGSASCANDPGGRRGAGQRRAYRSHFRPIETVRDEYRDAPRSDSRFRRCVVHLGQGGALLAVIRTERLLGHHTTDVCCNRPSELEVDVVQELGVALVHDRIVAMRQFERKGGDNVSLLVRGQRVPEQLRLVVMLLEFRGADSLFDPFDDVREAGRYVRCTLYEGNERSKNSLGKAPFVCRHWFSRVEAIRPVIWALGDAVSLLPIAVVIQDRAYRPVNRNLRASQSIHSIERWRFLPLPS